MSDIENTLNRLIAAIDKHSAAMTSGGAKAKMTKEQGPFTFANPAPEQPSPSPVAPAGKGSGAVREMAGIGGLAGLGTLLVNAMGAITKVLHSFGKEKKGMAEEYIDVSMSARNSGRELNQGQRERLEGKIIDRGQYKIDRRAEAFKAFDVTNLTGDYPLFDTIAGGLGLNDEIRKYQNSVEIIAMDEIKQRHKNKSANRNKP